jgi:hypothetical protein
MAAHNETKQANAHHEMQKAPSACSFLAPPMLLPLAYWLLLLANSGQGPKGNPSGGNCASRDFTILS